MRAAVCVPVRADLAGLEVTLAALARVAPAARVVVAVDGPDAAVEALAAGSGAEVVVTPSPQGSYAARNLAIDALVDGPGPRGVGRLDDLDVVAFTDAGCEPLAGWLEAHLVVLAEADLSGGAVVRTLPDPLSPAAYVDAVRNLNQQAYVEVDGFAATCNLAVRPVALRQLRFDGTARSGGDRAFGQAAGDLGLRLAYAEAAKVAHDCRTTTRAVLRKATRVGSGVAALPARSRPVRLPPVRLRLALARRAWHEGRSRSPIWLGRLLAIDALRTFAFRRAAQRGGFRPGAPPPGAAVQVVVLLGTRWAELEAHPSRWRSILDLWAADLVGPDRQVSELVVVDYPRVRLRPLLGRDGALAHAATSWHPGVRCIDATLPSRPAASAIDPIAWRRVGRAVRRCLGPPPASGRLVVAATPLWAPVLPHLAATWTHFDAVDDWRELAVEARLPGRADAGYRSAARPPVTATAVAAPLARTLRHDVGLDAVVVGNGVDGGRFRPGPPPHADVATAVYVGVIEGRVDLDLLAAVADAAGPGRVVVAGPAHGPAAARLAQLRDDHGLVWLGRIPHDQVAEVLAGAAVGLVPHLANDLTRSMDPLKLLEYLAAGLPVVSTAIELPADLAAAPITVAPDTAAFVAATCAALATPVRHDGHAVGHRSWPGVATRILDVALGRDAGGSRGRQA